MDRGAQQAAVHGVAKNWTHWVTNATTGNSEPVDIINNNKETYAQDDQTQKELDSGLCDLISPDILCI